MTEVVLATSDPYFNPPYLNRNEKKCSRHVIFDCKNNGIVHNNWINIFYYLSSANMKTVAINRSENRHLLGPMGPKHQQPLEAR